jgi:mannose-6-phosphate isomerase-like protein (cupin superfamily)
MRLKMAILGMVCLAAGAAALPGGFEHWSTADLQVHLRKLGGKATSDTVGTWGNHSLIVAHRDESGEAEIHEGKVDVMFIQSGEAELVIGGTVPDAKTTGAGEMRGTHIEGGEHQAVRPGDVIRIPARAPHQMLLKSGQKIDYYTVKITE